MARMRVEYAKRLSESHTNASNDQEERLTLAVCESISHRRMRKNFSNGFWRACFSESRFRQKLPSEPIRNSWQRDSRALMQFSGLGGTRLVRLLDRAHYVRYDFSTATKLLEVCQELKRRYGTLTNLLAQARTAPELSRTLQEFKYIGPVTTRIFLRDIRPIWYRSAAFKKGT